MLAQRLRAYNADTAITNGAQDRVFRDIQLTSLAASSGEKEDSGTIFELTQKHGY